MPSPMPWARFVLPGVYAPSSTGEPVPGAKLYFYESESTTPLDTYSDGDMSVPNTNPVIADANGIFPSIFLQQQEYRVVLTDQDGVEAYVWDPVVPPTSPTSSSSTPTFVLEMTVDGNGQVPQTGVCGDLYVPFACTITEAVLQADQPGSVIVDVWAAPFAVNTPPTAQNSITASAPPTLDTAESSIDTTLTGWDTDLVAGTAVRFNIVSVDTITRFTLSLVVTATVAS